MFGLGSALVWGFAEEVYGRLLLQPPGPAMADQFGYRPFITELVAKHLSPFWKPNSSPTAAPNLEQQIAGAVLCMAVQEVVLPTTADCSGAKLVKLDWVAEKGVCELQGMLEAQVGQQPWQCSISMLLTEQQRQQQQRQQRPNTVSSAVSSGAAAAAAGGQEAAALSIMQGTLVVLPGIVVDVTALLKGPYAQQHQANKQCCVSVRQARMRQWQQQLVTDEKWGHCVQLQEHTRQLVISKAQAADPADSTAADSKAVDSKAADSTAQGLGFGSHHTAAEFFSTDGTSLCRLPVQQVFQTEPDGQLKPAWVVYDIARLQAALQGVLDKGQFVKLAQPQAVSGSGNTVTGAETGQISAKKPEPPRPTFNRLMLRCDDTLHGSRSSSRSSSSSSSRSSSSSNTNRLVVHLIASDIEVGYEPSEVRNAAADFQYEQQRGGSCSDDSTAAAFGDSLSAMLTPGTVSIQLVKHPRRLLLNSSKGVSLTGPQVDVVQSLQIRPNSSSHTLTVKSESGVQLMELSLQRVHVPHLLSSMWVAPGWENLRRGLLQQVPADHHSQAFAHLVPCTDGTSNTASNTVSSSSKSSATLRLSVSGSHTSYDTAAIQAALPDDRRYILESTEQQVPATTVVLPLEWQRKSVWALNEAEWQALGLHRDDGADYDYVALYQTADDRLVGVLRVGQGLLTGSKVLCDHIYQWHRLLAVRDCLSGMGDAQSAAAAAAAAATHSSIQGCGSKLLQGQSSSSSSSSSSLSSMPMPALALQRAGADSIQDIPENILQLLADNAYKAPEKLNILGLKVEAVMQVQPSPVVVAHLSSVNLKAKQYGLDTNLNGGKYKSGCQELAVCLTYSAPSKLPEANQCAARLWKRPVNLEPPFAFSRDAGLTGAVQAGRPVVAALYINNSSSRSSSSSGDDSSSSSDDSTKHPFKKRKITEDGSDDSSSSSSSKDGSRDYSSLQLLSVVPVTGNKILAELAVGRSKEYYGRQPTLARFRGIRDALMWAGFAHVCATVTPASASAGMQKLLGMQSVYVPPFSAPIPLEATLGSQKSNAAAKHIATVMQECDMDMHMKLKAVPYDCSLVARAEQEARGQGTGLLEYAQLMQVEVARVRVVPIIVSLSVADSEGPYPAANSDSDSSSSSSDSESCSEEQVVDVLQQFENWRAMLEQPVTQPVIQLNSLS